MHNHAKSEEVRNIARRNKTDFTRNRKMTFEEHLKLMMTKRGMSLQMELRENRKEKMNITKQGYSKSRQKIRPEVFEYLNRKYVESIYKTKEILVYKGYLLLGVDGTTNELPNCQVLKEYYGISQGQKNSVGRVRARVEGVYDCLNHVMIASKIEPYKVSEKELALKLVKEVKENLPKEKTIMVFDRYYFGVEFVHELEKQGQKFVMRIRDDHYKEEKKEAGEDGIVEIKIRTNSIFYASEENKEELKKRKTIKVRIIKVEVGETVEYLATNLTEEEMNREEAKEVYHLRWEIEKGYDVIKNKIQIENYSSRTKEGIETEFYAGILVHNMIEDIASEAEEKKTRKGKYEYKVNKNILVGIYRQEIIRVLEIEEEPERELAYKKMIEEMSKNVVEIKPGRRYERRRMHSMNKYRHNLRRNS